MIIRFTVGDSLYDCNLQITDDRGIRYYTFPTINENDLLNGTLEVDISGSSFELTVIPLFPEYKKSLDEISKNSFKDKLVNKLASMALSSFNDLILRVGCKYVISNLYDGAVIHISQQEYVFGTLDKLDLLELMPVIYAYYEIIYQGERLKPINTFELNRMSLVKSARKLTLADFGLHLIITYPLQVGRVKHLTKNRKIFKTISSFHSMSEEKRQKILNRNKEL